MGTLKQAKEREREKKERSKVETRAAGSDKINAKIQEPKTQT